LILPGKNVNHMVVSTSGPNLVLLEESEPNSPFIALTLLHDKSVKQILTASNHTYKHYKIQKPQGNMVKKEPRQYNSVIFISKKV